MNERDLEKQTIYKVIHGSRCYGTNIPGSDYDEKGIAILNGPRYYFGFDRFEQKDGGWEDGGDRVIYDIRKFFRLALACNPNIIEVLYVDPEHVLKMDPKAVLICANRDIFLSRSAAKTFTGYAVSQMKKLKNKLGSGGKIKWKHAMHLVRLMRMGHEIVTTGEVKVKRPDADYLLEIRHGNVSIEKVFEEAEQLLSKIDDSVVDSPLPRQPDRELAENMMIELIQESLA